MGHEKLQLQASAANIVSHMTPIHWPHVFRNCIFVYKSNYLIPSWFISITAHIQVYSCQCLMDQVQELRLHILLQGSSAVLQETSEEEEILKKRYYKLGILNYYCFDLATYECQWIYCRLSDAQEGIVSDSDGRAKWFLNLAFQIHVISINCSSSVLEAHTIFILVHLFHICPRYYIANLISLWNCIV